jgi:hypothetical protein
MRTRRIRRLKKLLAALVGLACALLNWPGASAQQASSPQPLNGSVSDYGTTFVFSPPPICGGCVETELGFQSLSDGRYIPAVVSYSPVSPRTDISALVNLLDSEAPKSRRATHFGNQLDFVLRRQILQKGGFELTLAPRGAALVRGSDGGRVGATAAPQLSWGRNLAVLNVTLTAGIGVSSTNPRTDCLTDFDYFRTLDTRGTAFFLGLQHEVSAGQQTASTEEGLVIPFRNGQVELETAQIDLNSGFEEQFQARVIVNWGKALKRR